MKKLLLLFLCVPLIFSCGDKDKIKKLEDRIAKLENNNSLAIGDIEFGQTTYVPDDIFEQRLITLGYDNILDDYVQTSNF